MLANEHLQFADECEMAALCKPVVDARFEARNAKLIEARDLSLSETQGREVGQRWSAPACERVVVEPLADETLDAVQVELTFVDVQQVAGRPRLQPLFAQKLAQLRDVDLHGLLRGLGRLVLPKRVDQAAGRDDAIRLQQEYRQQRALFLRAEVE